MRGNRIQLGIAVAIFALLASFSTTPVLYAADPLRIEKNELKEMLGSPSLVIIDARAGRDWTSSEFKIKGAVREEAEKVDQWATKYAKDKTIVIYCA